FRSPAGLAQAQAYLDMNQKEGVNTAADRRAQILVRGTQPETRKAALHDLEEQFQQTPPARDEQYRLVLLYEADGNAAAAEKQMTDLLTRGDPNNPAYLAHHIRFLLQTRDKDEEGVWK